MPGNVLNLAHRGFRARCPENTMAAFRRALETPGCNGVELDVQLSRDGALAVIHDETVDRTTNGRGAVKDLTLAQLRALDAGGGEHIPMLGEYLELAASVPGCITNIELKNGVEPYPGMEELVISAVRQHGLSAHVILSSFKHDSVILCQRLAPEMQTGLLCATHETAPGKPLQKVLGRMQGNGIDYLHPGAHALSVELLDALEAADVKVVAWNVDTPGVARRLAAEPFIHGLITDDPAMLAGVLEARR